MIRRPTPVSVEGGLFGDHKNGAGRFSRLTMSTGQAISAAGLVANMLGALLFWPAL